MARPQAIKPISSEENFINMMLYGEPGAGKSAMAASSPKALILANDASQQASSAILGLNADVWVIHDYGDLDDAYNYVRHEGINAYEWVWIDNASLFQDQGMDMIMEDLVAAKPHRDKFVPDKAEYLQNQNRLALYVRYFKALDIHFGMTAHTMRMEDEDGKVTIVPMFQGGQGNLSQKLCGMMNVVGFLSNRQLKEGSERKLYLTKRTKYYTKDRFDTYPKTGVLMNPTIPQFMADIKKKLPSLGATATPAESTRKAGSKKKTTGTSRTTNRSK